MGFADSFVHADYISSLARANYLEFNYTREALVIGFFLLIVGLCGSIYFHYMKKRAMKKTKKKKNN